MAMQPTAAEANVRELSTAERVGAALALSASDTASFARSIAAIPDPAQAYRIQGVRHEF